MNREALRERKAISGAIMVLILIGIAVVAGIVVFTAFNTSSSTAAIKNAAQVETLTIVNPAGEDTSAAQSLLVTATLKNTGNKAIQGAQIILMVKNGEGDDDRVIGELNNFGNPLAPGESARIEMSAEEGDDDNEINESVDINLGRFIPVLIIINLVDGSQMDIATKGAIQ